MQIDEDIFGDVTQCVVDKFPYFGNRLVVPYVRVVKFYPNFTLHIQVLSGRKHWSEFIYTGQTLMPK